MEAGAYKDSVKIYRDLKNSIDTAREKAVSERKVEIVRKSIREGLDVETISRITGISIPETEKIRKKG